MSDFLDLFGKKNEVSQRKKFANDERDALYSLFGKKRKTTTEQILEFGISGVFLPIKASVILLKLSQTKWLKDEIEERRRLRNTIIKFSIGGGLVWICFFGGIASFFITQIYAGSAGLCWYDYQKRLEEDRLAEAFIRAGIYDSAGHTPKVLKKSRDEVVLALPAIPLSMLEDKKGALQQILFEGGCRIKQILPSGIAHNQAIIKISHKILGTYYPFQDYIEFFRSQEKPIVIVGCDGDELLTEELSKTAYHWKVLGTTRFGKSSWGRSMLLALLLGSADKVEIHASDFKAGIEMNLFLNYTGSGVAKDEFHACLLIQYLHQKMEERLEKYSRAGVVDIHEYRQKIDPLERFIILFIDEFADFIDSVRERYEIEKRRKKKEGGEAVNYEQLLISIGRRSASTGISMFVLGQYLTADILNSNLSNQLGSKICYPVDSISASTQILNCGDAASGKLAKIKGRFLYSTGSLVEMQGLFISREDAENVLRQYVKPVSISNDFIQFVESQPDTEERRKLLEKLREEQIRRQSFLSRLIRRVVMLNNASL